jgi:2-oxoglutarate dehydrogenase E1 component
MKAKGPEHSSGRIERFLQLTAHDNIQIVQPTTPAQIFHLLRRQVVRPYQQAPRGIHSQEPAAAPGCDFQPPGIGPGGVSSDPGRSPGIRNVAAVKRLVFCSGRVYFDLAKTRKGKGIAPISASSGSSSLYPVPDLELQALLARYPNTREIIWAQDEPRNQGPWRFMAHHLAQLSQSADTCLCGPAGILGPRHRHCQPPQEAIGGNH